MLHCSHTFPHKHIMRCIFGVLCCICSFLCRIFCTHSYSELQLPCSHRVGRSSGASRPAAYHSTPTQSHPLVDSQAARYFIRFNDISLINLQSKVSSAVLHWCHSCTQVYMYRCANGRHTGQIYPYFFYEINTKEKNITE